MRLLVAAVDPDPAGFTWTVTGELVIAGAFCDLADDEHHDPTHECMVVFAGLASDRACTLARVADVDITRAQLRAGVRDHWRRCGVEAAPDEVEREAAAMLADAEDHRPGTLLRRYGTAMRPA